MRARLLVAVSLFAWRTGALAGLLADDGQAKRLSSSTVKETITVSVVEVPVTVVDRDGHSVRGLTAANFRIVDEGVSRPVTSFDFVDHASLASLSATSPLNPAARRNFMLLFDLTFSSPNSITRAQQAARDFVMKMMQRRDRVAVGTIDAAHGFRLVTAFTTDRALLNAAIARPATFIGSDPLQIAGGAAGVEVPEASAAPDSARGGATAEMNEVTRRLNRVEDQYSRDRVNRQLDLMAGLARTLRTISGQKHIVLLSEGFEPRLVQGRDAGFDAEQLRDNNSIEHGQIWNVDNDNRFGSVQSINILDRLSDACRKSDVILHAVDIKGVRSYVDASEGFDKKSNEGLHVLAGATGGTVFQNTNNIASDFQHVLEHHEVSYVLGFNGATSEPGRFHRITVKLVDAPPGSRLTARAGYYESGRGESAVERTFSNAEVVLNDLPQEAIHVAELAAPFTTSGLNAQVPVILEIRGDDLLAAARNDVATTEIFVYAFDDDGLVRDSLFERIALDVPQVRNKLQASGLKYYGTLSLPAGRYAIKSLVRVKETETRGFTRRDIVVPTDADVAISQPLFVEEPGKWVMVKGGTHDKTHAAYPFEVDGQPFIPSAAVSMKSGQPRRFVVFVQNASPDEMTFDTNPRATVVSQLRSTNGSKLVFQLDGAIANASSLNITIRKKGSADERTSSVALVP
jgi:VWFA-related protein